MLRTTPRRSTALLAVGVLALGGLTAACEDDDGTDDVDLDVDDGVEEDLNDVQEDVEDGVDEMEDEVDDGLDDDTDPSGTGG